VPKTSVAALFLLSISTIARADGSAVDSSINTPEHAPGEKVEQVTVMEVEMRGKPPYRRTYKTLPMSDADRPESGSQSNTKLEGRPPFKRN
jgi:hypothetical protein